MNSSLEDALSLLKNWKSDSAEIYLVSIGSGIKFWCKGVLEHVAFGEVHFGMRGVEGRDFSIIVSMRDAGFEYRDSREPLHFWPAGRDRLLFEDALEVRFSNGDSVTLAKLRREDTGASNSSEP